jgi:hypothetical protein
MFGVDVLGGKILTVRGNPPPQPTIQRGTRSFDAPSITAIRELFLSPYPRGYYEIEQPEWQCELTRVRGVRVQALSPASFRVN